MVRGGLWAVPALALALTALARRPDPAGFPHQRHAGLFPTCVACHQGIETGSATAVYPSPTDCARCHDGVQRARVAWKAAQPLVTNLAFSHPRHDSASAAGGSPAACLVCHGVPGADSRMAVAPARPEACIGCHAHAAPQHLAASANCTRCHLPLTRATALDTTVLRGFPRPPSHRDSAFVLGHDPGAAGVASCSICHARQSCERCHANADRVPAIQALAPDPRVAALVRGRAPTYPRPASHGSDAWKWRHAASARADVARCADCHTRASCQVCHQAGNSQIAALPAPAPERAPGVTLSPAVRVHPAGFRTGHRVQASTLESCSSCHTRDFCSSCHNGPITPSFHPADFLDRHAAEAYGNQSECTSCHNTELFCRSCHRAGGRAGKGGVEAAFHSAQPNWLLGHGQAARQSIESCAACHAQTDCTRCHSAVGGWGVNPHGAGFDPQRAQKANAVACLRCHTAAEIGQP